jgi:hypothetical protein
MTYISHTYTTYPPEEEEGEVLPTGRYDLVNTAVAVSNHIPQPKRGPRIDYVKLVNNYYDLVMTELKLNWRNPSQTKLNLYHIRRERIKRKLGQYSELGKRKFWLDWFEQSLYSLYTIVQLGNNLTEENTIVKLNYDMADAEDLTHWSKAAIQEYFGVIEPGESYLGTPIDLQSLNIFIQRSLNVESMGRWDSKSNSYKYASEEYKAKARENLKQAVCILKLQEDGVLKQAAKDSDFGRLYLTGLNLQNSSKELRHAALGHCYSIDINVCSQAWRVYSAECINPNIMTRHSKDLIKDKLAFRQRVAKLLGDKHTGRAKQIITAIGFGADIEASPWPTGNDNYKLPAIREILSKEEVEMLTTSRWFMEFIDEQKTMNKLILEHYLLHNPKDTIPQFVKTKSGSIHRNKIMACLYQQAERTYLEEIVDYVQRRFGAEEILLLVHDAVYIKHSINRAELVSALQQFNPYLNVEITEHYGHFIQTEEKKEPNTAVELYKHALATGDTALLEQIVMELNPNRHSVSQL